MTIRAELTERFLRYVAIESQSDARATALPSTPGQQSLADLLARELRALGLSDVVVDDHATVTAVKRGNRPGAPRIGFIAHLDTVDSGLSPVVRPQILRFEGEDLCLNRDQDIWLRVANHPEIRPWTGEDILFSDGTSVLGADNKAAIAVLLVAVGRVLEEGIPHAGIELLFTPCEEVGLKGAAAFDIAALEAKAGFVYDHTGALGEIIQRAPTLHRIEATFVGRAAHAGIHPEHGRSAIAAAAAAIDRMPLGRVDAGTTANIGTVTGGTAANVVPERCTIMGEARGHDDDALSIQLTAMLDAVTWAATEFELDVETRVTREFTAYALGADDPQVRLARRAVEACGLAPRLIPSGGGSDVNAFARNGFPAVNLCNGMIDVHTPDERILPESLDTMVDITLAIIEAARTPG
jgi:tripeptide aminopeptidase